MLIELSITLLGRGLHMSEDLAEILKIVDDSDLRYMLTPSGTCIEGDWDEVMNLLKRCHDHARSLSTHVFTTVRIEDEAGATNKLIDNVVSVEHVAHRQLRREVLIQRD